ncbi:glycine N-acyltransferase-like protein 3 [Chiroxiphia lanceolata]|uniref:glycine N-acyltransferase-like protein 3 n=1 Tax=Chiroxiphia lanceolata TaxID=296741 RepID=UPI0013CE73B2|nr:glycine N-acyltransferase-like protein 3 [Chiroxiphia lanceolata]
MQILRCPAQLRLLEETLRKSLPTTLPVLGTVMTVARGNPAAHEVLVDSWPDFGIVLTRLRPEEHKDPKDHYTNQLAVFYRDKGALQALLGGTEAVVQARAFQILGLQEGLDEAVREAAGSKGLQVETIRYLGLMSPEPPRPRGQLPPGLRLAPVSPSHVPLLNATWAQGGNARSRAFLLGLVRALPSACLLGPRGRPVSWTLLDAQGCLRHGYTVPAWRGRGLTGLTMAAMGRGLHARGFPIYCTVLPHNAAALSALGAIGFVTQPGTFYLIVGTPK